MKKTAASILVWAAIGFSQDTLTVNQPVAKELKKGVPQSFTIRLNAGDYAAGVVDQQGTPVDVAIYVPDGSRLRVFPGSPEPKRGFAFIAEAAGAYRLELRAPDHAGKCELRLNEVLSLDQRMSPGPRKDRYISARIDALRKQVASGDKNTEAFWAAIAKEHTPWVEPVEKDEKHQLATFLWRGGADTRNVLVLFYPFVSSRPQDYTMKRIEGTDVWYVTTRFPRGARFAYQLSPNDPLIFEGPASNQRNASAQADPLNPNRWACGASSSKFSCQSMAELPGAPPQPWITRKDGVAAGEVKKYSIKSEILKNEHNLSVYQPAGYRANGTPYALMVVFDESAYLDRVPTPVILDNLIAASKIPPMVAVLIANPSPATRNKELPPNPNFADFLAKELIPWTHAHYNVTSDPQQIVVAGSSYGGIASVFAGLRHPEVFGNILCQSGSFWWTPERAAGFENDAEGEPGWLAKQFLKVPKLPLKFYMDAGSFEVDTAGGGGAILEPSRHMRDVLLAKGYEVHYQQFVGGHDYISWRGTLADGLIALVGKADTSTQ